MEKKPRIEILNVVAPVTLYLKSEFGMGYSRIEARSVKVSAGPWAQYEKAYWVEWMPKGARKPRMTIISGYDPKGYVMAGHNLAKEPAMFGAPDADGTAMGRHSGFSPEWDREMAETVSKIGAKVLFDASKNP